MTDVIRHAPWPLDRSWFLPVSPRCKGPTGSFGLVDVDSGGFGLLLEAEKLVLVLGFVFVSCEL